MARDDDDREVVYVVRDSEAPLTHMFLGAVLGAGLALLFAPTSGEDTRRSLRRRAGQLRTMAEEGFGELEDRLSDGTSRVRDRVLDTVDDVRAQAEEVTDAVKGAGTTAREELERRLADARSRRRGDSAEFDELDEEEEPVA